MIWFDAQDAKDNWVRQDDDFEKWTQTPCEVISYGHLVRNTEYYTVLAADVCDDGILGRVTKIPNRWILELKTYDSEV